MLRSSLKLAVGAFALFLLDVADLNAQTGQTSETAQAESLHAGVSAGKTYACPGNVPVGERAVRFNGTVTTTNPNGISYQVLIRYGAGGDPAGEMEHRDLTTSIGTWSVGMSDAETSLELNVTVTPAQPLEWAAELWGIDPGNVYHIWQTRNNGTLSRDETCEYLIVGTPDLAITIDRMHPNYVDGETGRFHFPGNGTFEYTVSVVNNGDDADTYGFAGGMGPTMSGVPQLFEIVSVEPSHGAPVECTIGNLKDSFGCDGQSLAKNESVEATVTFSTLATGSGAVSVGGGADGEQNFGDNSDVALIEVLAANQFGRIKGRKHVRVPGSGPGEFEEYPLDAVPFELRNMGGEVLARTYSGLDPQVGPTTTRTLEGRGTFEFENVPAGDYVVAEVPAEHLKPFDPLAGQLQVVVIPGQTTMVDFLNDSTRMDWGDLPDQRDDSRCRFRYCYATYAPYGAAHLISKNLFLGGSGVVAIDGEPEGQASFAADGDDFDFSDDENGINFDTLFAGGMGQISADVFFRSLSEITVPRLLGWIDFNDDSYLSYRERIIDEIVTNGVQTFSFPIPPGAGLYFARFRLASNPPNGSIISADVDASLLDEEDPASYGFFADGEVEDYSLGLFGIDWGDAPQEEDPDRPDIPFGYPTSADSNGARHVTYELSDFRIGDRLDGEINANPSTEADGDDYTNLYDEDGIRFDAGFVPYRVTREPREKSGLRTIYGFSQGSEVTLTPLANRDGIIDAWFDFNRNGSWADPGEKVIDSDSVQSGPFYTQLTFSVPPDADPGWTFARFRFSLIGGLDYVGAVQGGEVEDHLLRILPTAFHINSLEDSGPGTLRQAIEEANATDGTDPQYIVYDPGAGAGKTDAVIMLQSPLPEITNPIIISGGGELVLDGSGAGAFASGFELSGGSAGIYGTTIQNFSLHGIRLASANNVVAENEIRGNGGDGVHVNVSDNNVILANRISDNGGLGIDHAEDGPTANDPGDVDGIPNRPEITSVVQGSTTISVILSAIPNSDYIIQFFSNEACDESGSGEGAEFLTATDVSTDGTGVVAVDLVLEETLPKGLIITATATGQIGTSEFSECQVVTQSEGDADEVIPESFVLGQNYPNPFVRVTTIPFEVPSAGHVRIEVFNSLGQVVDVPVDGSYAPGSHRLALRAESLPSGVYFYRMTAGSSIRTGKMIVVR